MNETLSVNPYTEIIVYFYKCSLTGFLLLCFLLVCFRQAALVTYAQIL